MKITLFIQALQTGGAETQLTNLAFMLKKRGMDVSVLTYTKGRLDQSLIDQQIPIHYLDQNNSSSFIVRLFKLSKYLREHNIEILYSFLHVPNLMASLVKILNPEVKIIWGIRDSLTSNSNLNLKTKVALALTEITQIFTERIITNSQYGLQSYSELYSNKKLKFVPNGINTEKFNIVKSPSNSDPTSPTIGIIGSVLPVKNHELLINALPRVLKAFPLAQVNCVGNVSPPRKKKLDQLINKLQLESHWNWLPATGNAHGAISDLDLLVSCSYSEGFSNVICEALSCGVPVVATNVGDNRAIINDDRYLCDSNNVEQLASCITSSLGTRHDPARLRSRIVNNYSLSLLTDRSLEAFFEPVAD